MRKKEYSAKRKMRGALYMQRGGANKVPYPVFVAPYYQQGYGMPEFWKRRVVPFWNKVKVPLAKALIFGGKVLKDRNEGKSLTNSLTSNLPNLLGKQSSAGIKSPKSKIPGKRKRAVKRVGRKSNSNDIFS